MQPLKLFEKPLSPRKWAIVELVATGLPNKLVAYKLNMTEGTVKTYLSFIFERTGCSNRTELTIWYFKNFN